MFAGRPLRCRGPESCVRRPDVSMTSSVDTDTSMEKRPALGKGLSALIPDPVAVAPAPAVDADIDRLTPNQFQPRVDMNDARLEELAQSIRTNGVIQPIVVRQIGDRYQIIAGERRWRAAQLAGL